MDDATFIPVISKSREDSSEELRCTAKVELQRKAVRKNSLTMFWMQ